MFTVDRWKGKCRWGNNNDTTMNNILIDMASFPYIFRFGVPVAKGVVSDLETFGIVVHGEVSRELRELTSTKNKIDFNQYKT